MMIPFHMLLLVFWFGNSKRDQDYVDDDADHVSRSKDDDDDDNVVAKETTRLLS